MAGVGYRAVSSAMDAWLSRVEPAGGRILVDKTNIGGSRGAFAYVEDTEGNRVGLTFPS
ncbi:hypothetical protein [Microbacterium schleiferi]|uniref:hypothetical protein n=1 Tax=Microbacterium schleiferi TaxID=69362 RepID=UPI00311FEAD7